MAKRIPLTLRQLFEKITLTVSPMIFTNRKSGKKPVEISGFSNCAKNLYKRVSDIKEPDCDISFFIFFSPKSCRTIGRFSKKRFLRPIFD